MTVLLSDRINKGKLVNFKTKSRKKILNIKENNISEIFKKMYILAAIILILLIIKIYQKLTLGICTSNDRMDDKVVIVTGSNTGIGYETAKDLAQRGAKVILACRDFNKGMTARDNIIKATGNQNVHFKPLDLASFESVNEFVNDILESESKLDVLINNAGTGNAGNFLTVDSLPYEAQVNHFSPFLLTIRLLLLLKKSAPSRIINVASIMHNAGKIDIECFDKPARNALERTRVYSNTKLANILFTRQLSQVLRGSGVTVNCLHPGAVNTEIFRDNNFILKFLISIFFKTAKEGAQTSIYLAVAREVDYVSGKYFSECKEKRPSLHAENNELAKKLWKLSFHVIQERIEDEEYREKLGFVDSMQ